MSIIRSYLSLINSNVAYLKPADLSLDVRGCQGFNVAEEDIGLQNPEPLFQQLHRSSSQVDVFQTQPFHIVLNLALQAYKG